MSEDMFSDLFGYDETEELDDDNVDIFDPKDLAPVVKVAVDKEVTYFINNEDGLSLDNIEDFLDVDEDSMEIRDLADAIQEIRRRTESRRSHISELDHKKDPFRQSKKAVQEKLEILYSEIHKLEAEINQISAEQSVEQQGIVSDAHEIELLSKKQAQLIEKNGQAKNQAAMVRFLDKYCEDFPAWKSAWDHQKEDTVFTLEAWRSGKNGVLNANEMSLGKTYETMVALWIIQKEFVQKYGRVPKVLWLTKSSLVPETPKEIRHWTPEWPIVALQGSKTVQVRELATELAIENHAMLMTNYEVPRTTPLVRNIKWDLVVIDEVHKLKGGANSNGPTAVWKIVKDLCREAKFVFMLSGTPIVAQPEEMWSYLHIFNPERFPDLKRFKKMFGMMKNVGGELQLQIDANKLLNDALKGQMFRRTLQEVGGYMPELREIVRTLTMTDAQRAAYDQLRQQFFLWLDEQEGKTLTAMVIIAQLLRLRQLNTWPHGIAVKETDDEGHSHKLHFDLKESSKIDEAMDIIEEVIGEGQSIIVSSTFNPPLDEVADRCRALNIPVQVLNGSTSNMSGAIADEFRRYQGQVLCINSALGEGLNLHVLPERWEGGARTLIHLDKWYTPIRQEQVEGRIYRKGITNACTVYYLRNEDSVDNFIDSILHDRAIMIGSIADSEVLRPSGEWKEYLKDKI